MSHLPKVLNALSKLLSYPDESALQTAELLYVVLHSEHAEAAREASEFGVFAEHRALSELEEAFTGTFDVNPACALEVGWHLFGEEYARGMFLVRMREEMRKYKLPESNELPDHISHVLAIVVSMPADDATRFVRACVQPAVEKMKRALDGKETPYRHVIACLTLVLRHVWGEPAEDDVEPERDRTAQSTAFAADPLRDYPVAAVMSGGASPSGEPLDLVPLTVAPSLRPTADRSSRTQSALAPERPT